MIFLSIFLILIGLLMILKPEFIWSIAESWKSADATEPSSLYIGSIRFGGTMCMIVGLVSAVVYWSG